MMLKSLRLRLFAFAALSIAAALAVAGLSLVYIFERHIERRVEQELEAKLTELEAVFALDASGAPSVSRDLSDPRYRQPFGGSYWQIAEAGAVAASSRSLWDADLRERGASDPPGRAFEAEGPLESELYILDREITLVAGGKPRVFRLAVARDHSEIAALRASFIGDVARALGLIGLVLMAGAWVQTYFGLSPLRFLSGQLVAVRAGRALRLEGEFPDEVEPLAHDLNALLDAQAEQLRRARERAGSLAHGLKTPITILNVEARRLEQVGEVAAALAMREQLGFMRSHIERELARARTQGAALSRGAATDARAGVEKLFSLMVRLPRGGNIEWVDAVPEGTQIRMDPDDFGEVAGNLLDNARKWAASRVCVSMQTDGAGLQLHFDDDGPGIPADARERLSGRGATTAASAEEGSGLGLAIVADVLGEYSAAAQIGESPSGGCRVSFTVTAVAPPPRKAPAGHPVPAQS